jgi:hypothetical protein
MSKNRALLMLLSLVFASKVANSEDNLGLPKSKLDIVECQKEVISLHPGEIVNQKIVNTGAGISEIHFEIHDLKSIDWLVICDGATAKILKTIKLDAER